MVNYIKEETCGAGILHSLAFEATYYEDHEMCDDILASNEEIFNQMMNMCVMYDQQSVTLFFTALLFPDILTVLYTIIGR